MRFISKRRVFRGISIGISIGFLFFLGTIILFFAISPPITATEMSKKYDRNRGYINEVINFLSNEKVEDIWFSPSEAEHWKKFVEKNSEADSSSGDSVSSALDILFTNAGCQVITKEKGIIWFQFWSTLDSGRGIAYGTKEEIKLCLESFFDGESYSFEQLKNEDIYFFSRKTESHG